MLDNLLDDSLSEGERMVVLFSWVDERCAEHATRSVCRPGCAHCCRGPVIISQEEAALIAEASGRTCTGNAQAASSPFSTFCPLLDTEKRQCSVYEYRPMACRTKFAFDDPDLCARGALHQTYDLAHFANDHSEFIERNALADAIADLCGKFRSDIRFFFS